MPQRMIAATILLVAFELVTTTSVCAQSVADLDHTMRAMKQRNTLIAASHIKTRFLRTNMLVILFLRYMHS